LGLLVGLSLCLFFVHSDSPQSIVIFIGPGVGHGHLTADYFFNNNKYYQEFPVTGLIINDTADDYWITDGAAAATALATGVKVGIGKMAFSDSLGQLTTIFDLAQKQNKATGMVVTTSLTHMTPACFMAHSYHWGDEHEIAVQEAAAGVDVMLGGGRRFFVENETLDSNLIKGMEADGYTYISQHSQLEVLETVNFQRLIGLFALEALNRANQRNLSLQLMTRKAIELLEKQKNGYVLVVEGSQIDWAAHERDEDNLLHEMNDFGQAVQWVLDYQKKHPDILILLIGLYETGGLNLLKSSRYPQRGYLRFSTSHHTANFCPLFAKGPAAQEFTGWMHLSAVGKKLQRALY